MQNMFIYRQDTADQSLAKNCLGKYRNWANMSLTRTLMLQNPCKQQSIYRNYRPAVAAVQHPAVHPAVAAAVSVVWITAKKLTMYRLPKRKESLLWSVQQTQKQIGKMVHVCAKSVNLKERERWQEGMLINEIEVDSL